MRHCLVVPICSKKAEYVTDTINVTGNEIRSKSYDGDRLLLVDVKKTRRQRKMTIDTSESLFRKPALPKLKYRGRHKKKNEPRPTSALIDSSSKFHKKFHVSMVSVLITSLHMSLWRHCMYVIRFFDGIHWNLMEFINIFIYIFSNHHREAI